MLHKDDTSQYIPTITSILRKTLHHKKVDINQKPD